MLKLKAKFQSIKI